MLRETRLQRGERTLRLLWFVMGLDQAAAGATQPGLTEPLLACGDDRHGEVLAGSQPTDHAPAGAPLPPPKSNALPPSWLYCARLELSRHARLSCMRAVPSSGSVYRLCATAVAPCNSLDGHYALSHVKHCSICWPSRLETLLSEAQASQTTPEERVSAMFASCTHPGLDAALSARAPSVHTRPLFLAALRGPDSQPGDCVCRLLTLAGPLVVREVLSFSSSIISTAFVGRLGSAPLGAWFLAHTWLNTTGM